MSFDLTVRDETTAGDTTHELTLEGLTERLTVRDLIRARVYQEVKDYNVAARQKPEFRGLVQPSDVERSLNGVKLKTPREIDWQKQFDVALEAFTNSGFLLLVDNRQLDNLDEEIELRTDSKVSFLKLVPLVGG